jgi:hypothetical protein
LKTVALTDLRKLGMRQAAVAREGALIGDWIKVGDRRYSVMAGVDDLPMLCGGEVAFEVFSEADLPAYAHLAGPQDLRALDEAAGDLGGGFARIADIRRETKDDVAETLKFIVDGEIVNVEGRVYGVGGEESTRYLTCGGLAFEFGTTNTAETRRTSLDGWNHLPGDVEKVLATVKRRRALTEDVANFVAERDLPERFESARRTWTLIAGVGTLADPVLCCNGIPLKWLNADELPEGCNADAMQHLDAALTIFDKNKAQLGMYYPKRPKTRIGKIMRRLSGPTRLPEQTQKGGALGV